MNEDTTPATCATCGDPLDRPSGAGNRAACASAHGERPRCTCGALQHAGCFCNISLSDFLATPTPGPFQRTI